MPSRPQDDSPNDANAAAALPSTSFGGGDATLPLPDAGGVPVPARPAETPASFGRYLVVQTLGHGAFGDVYRGYDPQLARTVAIKAPRREKAISREAVVEFEAEARVLASLRHAGIVPVFDFGTTAEGRCYLVTAFVSGADLGRAMAEKKFAPREAALLVAAVAEALHYAHKLGVVHRDVKPANILLEEGLTPLLADFGLALREAEQRERAGEQSGTPAYMSPEQARGEAHRLDGRTDIWSLGVVLYELLTKRKPFQGETLAELYDEIEHREPKPPRQIDDAIPKELERICLKAMAKGLSDRYTTAQDMADELRRATAELNAELEGRANRAGPRAVLGNTITPPAGGDARLDDNVQFSLFRPKAIKPLREYRLLAFAHLGELPADAPEGTPEPLAEVREQAGKALGVDLGSYGQTVQESSADIPRWGTLTFVPEVSGVEFFPAQASFVWRGKTHQEQFTLQATPALAGHTARGRLNVFLGAILIAEVPLNLRVEAAEAAADDAVNEAERGRRFRRVYAAFAPSDRTIVAQFETYAAVMGDEFVAMCGGTRGDDDWTDARADSIRRADVFQLFWSSRSMRSPLVKQEWECALALARSDFVRPVYWEVPCPADVERNLPPPELKQISFLRIGAVSLRTAEESARVAPPHAAQKHTLAELKARLATDAEAERTAKKVDSTRQAAEEPAPAANEKGDARALKAQLDAQAAAEQEESAAPRPSDILLEPIMRTLDISALKAELHAKHPAKKELPEGHAATQVEEGSVDRFESHLAAQLDKGSGSTSGVAPAPQSASPDEPPRPTSIQSKLGRVRSARADGENDSPGDSESHAKPSDTVSSMPPPTGPKESSSADGLTDSAHDFVVELGAVEAQEFAEQETSHASFDEDSLSGAMAEEDENRPRFRAARPRSAGAAVNLGLGCILFALAGMMSFSTLALAFTFAANPEDNPMYWIWNVTWLTGSVLAIATTGFGAWRNSGGARVAWGVGCVLAAALAARTLYVMFVS